MIMTSITPKAINCNADAVHIIWLFSFLWLENFYIITWYNNMFILYYGISTQDTHIPSTFYLNCKLLECLLFFACFLWWIHLRKKIIKVWLSKPLQCRVHLCSQTLVLFSSRLMGVLFSKRMDIIAKYIVWLGPVTLNYTLLAWWKSFYLDWPLRCHSTLNPQFLHEYNSHENLQKDDCS